jgi:hypothetical protein
MPKSLVNFFSPILLNTAAAAYILTIKPAAAGFKGRQVGKIPSWTKRGAEELEFKKRTP